MEWLNVELVVAVLGVVGTILGLLGKAKYARVVADLVNSIEKANASDVKALAQSASFKSGTDKVLAKVVKKLTEGS